MSDNKIDLASEFSEKLSELDSETFMKLVSDNVSDELIETMVDHLEDFYGITEDEELGHLAQIMVTGYLIAKNEETRVLN